MMMWAACFVHTRHSGGSMVRMAEVRSRILAPVTSVTSRVPGWRQEDLLAVRTRVQAQFRQVQITIKQLLFWDLFFFARTNFFETLTIN